MRIPRALVFLCLVAFWTACSDKDGIPSDVIPREEMGNILWDMVQADQFAAAYIAKDSLIDWKDSLRNFRKDSSAKDPSTKEATRKQSAPPRLTAKDSARQRTEDSLQIARMKDVFRASLKTKTLQLYQQVFQVHHITLEEFRTSYRYYVKRPDITKILVDSVLARGNRLRMESYGHPSGDTAKKTSAATPPAPGQAAPGQAAHGTVPAQPAGGNSKLPTNFFLKTKEAAGAARRGRDTGAHIFAQP